MHIMLRSSSTKIGTSLKDRHPQPEFSFKKRFTKLKAINCIKFWGIYLIEEFHRVVTDVPGPHLGRHPLDVSVFI